MTQSPPAPLEPNAACIAVDPGALHAGRQHAHDTRTVTVQHDGCLLPDENLQNGTTLAKGFAKAVLSPSRVERFNHEFQTDCSISKPRVSDAGPTDAGACSLFVSDVKGLYGIGSNGLGSERIDSRALAQEAQIAAACGSQSDPALRDDKPPQLTYGDIGNAPTGAELMPESCVQSLGDEGKRRMNSLLLELSSDNPQLANLKLKKRKDTLEFCNSFQQIDTDIQTIKEEFIALEQNGRKNLADCCNYQSSDLVSDQNAGGFNSCSNDALHGYAPSTPTYAYEELMTENRGAIEPKFSDDLSLDSGTDRHRPGGQRTSEFVEAPLDRSTFVAGPKNSFPNEPLPTSGSVEEGNFFDSQLFYSQQPLGDESSFLRESKELLPFLHPISSLGQPTGPFGFVGKPGQESGGGSQGHSADEPILYDIKHRKRTSREQLVVLERSFAENPRPSSEQRKELAMLLDMTPRGVQIWFQNRRAKLKAKSRDEEHFNALRKNRELIRSANQRQSQSQIFACQIASPSSVISVGARSDYGQPLGTYFSAHPEPVYHSIGNTGMSDRPFYQLNQEVGNGSKGQTHSLSGIDPNDSNSLQGSTALIFGTPTKHEDKMFRNPSHFSTSLCDSGTKFDSMPYAMIPSDASLPHGQSQHGFMNCMPRTSPTADRNGNYLSCTQRKSFCAVSKATGNILTPELSPLILPSHSFSVPTGHPPSIVPIKPPKSNTFQATNPIQVQFQPVIPTGNAGKNFPCPQYHAFPMPVGHQKQVYPNFPYYPNMRPIPQGPLNTGKPYAMRPYPVVNPGAIAQSSNLCSIPYPCHPSTQPGSYYRSPLKPGSNWPGYHMVPAAFAHGRSYDASEANKFQSLFPSSSLLPELAFSNNMEPALDVMKDIEEAILGDSFDFVNSSSFDGTKSMQTNASDQISSFMVEDVSVVPDVECRQKAEGGERSKNGGTHTVATNGKDFIEERNPLEHDAFCDDFQFPPEEDAFSHSGPLDNGASTSAVESSDSVRLNDHSTDIFLESFLTKKSDLPMNQTEGPRDANESFFTLLSNYSQQNLTNGDGNATEPHLTTLTEFCDLSKSNHNMTTDSNPAQTQSAVANSLQINESFLTTSSKTAADSLMLSEFLNE